MALGCRLLPYEQYCFALSKPQLRGCMPLVSTGRLGMPGALASRPEPTPEDSSPGEPPKLLPRIRACPVLILPLSDGERQGTQRTRYPLEPDGRVSTTTSRYWQTTRR